MKTFRGLLAMGAFDGTFPPLSTPDEVERFHMRPDSNSQVKRCYELGKIYRGTERDLTAEEVQELDDIIAVEPGALFRYLAEKKAEKLMAEQWGF